MGMRTETIDVYTCDGCGHQVTVEYRSIPGGYHGTVFLVPEDGYRPASFLGTRPGTEGSDNPAVTWYACKVSCILPAVRKVTRTRPASYSPGSRLV